MRRILAVLCVAAVVAAACSEATAPEPESTILPATTTTTEPSGVETAEPEAVSYAYGGSVVIGEDQEPVTLNPFVPGGDNSITSIIGQAHLAGAYDIDGVTLELIPELLVELPSVGNGGVVVNDNGTMTVRYRIRDEAVWSDGVPITGYDFELTANIKNSLDWDIDEPLPDVVAMEADEKSFEFTLARPTAQYETMFPVVVPKHTVEGSDFVNDWNDVTWPAAGPFVFDEWARGEYIRLVRNENYWKVDEETGVQLPWLDSVEFRFVPEAETIVYQFTQRELDVIQPPPAPEIIDRLRELESAGVEVQVKPGPVWEHLSFQFGPNNRNPESMNEYTAFRQAVAYAINSDELAALVGWQPISSMLRPWVVDDDGPWSQYAQDLPKARDLIEQVCAEVERDCETDAPRLIFSTTSNAWARPLIAEQLKTVLGAVGIEVELQLEDSQLFFGETLDNGTWDVGWWAWLASPGAAGAASSLDLLDPDAPPPDGTNYYRWGTSDSAVKDDSVERYREILGIIRGTVDPDELDALTRAAEQIIAENAVIIPVGARSVIGAVWADKLAGYEMNASHASHTWNIEHWRRVDQ